VVKLITSLYVITIGWTGVMIIQEWIRPYILICTIILLYVISKIIKKNKIYYKVFGIRDSLLICFIVYVIALSFFLPNPKTFNYILAYGFVFTIAYSVTKYFFAINTNNHLIQKYNLQYFMNNSIDYDIWLMINCDILVLTKSTFPIIAAHYFQGSQVYYQIWPTIACLGIGTKYNKSNWMGFE